MGLEEFRISKLLKYLIDYIVIGYHVQQKKIENAKKLDLNGNVVEIDAQSIS